mmetsp:Transcript_3060/g.6331  ORF Transcript_3060/g.6331 Transcript_3060/m.6331 type:complete len:194 (-) Transcript_3060:924-1505(-)
MSKGKKNQADLIESLKQISTQRSGTTSYLGGPKRPLSAYTFYFIGMRSQVVAKFPGTRPTDIMRKLGAMWKGTSEPERKPFSELYEADRDRYDRQMDQFEAEGVFYDDSGKPVAYRNPKRKRRVMHAEPEAKRDPKSKKDTAAQPKKDAPSNPRKEKEEEMPKDERREQPKKRGQSQTRGAKVKVKAIVDMSD